MLDFRRMKRNEPADIGSGSLKLFRDDAFIGFVSL